MDDENQQMCVPPAVGLAPDVVDTGLPFLEHALEHSVEAVPGGASPVGGLGILTGPLGIAVGVNEYKEGVEKGDVAKALQGGVGTLAGTASTIEGVSTIAAYGLGAGAAGESAGAIAAAAGTAAPVLAAGTVGLAAGTGMAKAADSDYTKTGAWGTNAAGTNLSAMDWGARWGTRYDQWAGNKEPSVMGGIAAGLGGMAGGISGAAQAGWNWLTGRKD